MLTKSQIDKLSKVKPTLEMDSILIINSLVANNTKLVNENEKMRKNLIEISKHYSYYAKKSEYTIKSCKEFFEIMSKYK